MPQTYVMSTKRRKWEGRAILILLILILSPPPFRVESQLHKIPSTH
jgi:hypothetical protein